MYNMYKLPHPAIYVYLMISNLTLLSAPETARMSPVMDQLACHTTSLNVFRTYRVHNRDKGKGIIMIIISVGKLVVSMTIVQSTKLSRVRSPKVITQLCTKTYHCAPKPTTVHQNLLLCTKTHNCAPKPTTVHQTYNCAPNLLLCTKPTTVHQNLLLCTNAPKPTTVHQNPQLCTKTYNCAPNLLLCTKPTTVH